MCQSDCVNQQRAQIVIIPTQQQQQQCMPICQQMGCTPQCMNQQTVCLKGKNFYS